MLIHDRDPFHAYIVHSATPAGAKGNVPNILVFNFQRTDEGNILPLIILGDEKGGLIAYFRIIFPLFLKVCSILLKYGSSDSLFCTVIH